MPDGRRTGYPLGDDDEVVSRRGEGCDRPPLSLWDPEGSRVPNRRCGSTTVLGKSVPVFSDVDCVSGVRCISPDPVSLPEPRLPLLRAALSLQKRVPPILSTPKSPTHPQPVVSRLPSQLNSNTWTFTRLRVPQTHNRRLTTGVLSPTHSDPILPKVFGGPR